MMAASNASSRVCLPGPEWPARRIAVLALCSCILLWPAAAQAQITAVARPGATPAWDKGMIPINAENYYHAIECGKQGGKQVPSVARSVATGQFTYDYPAWAPTTGVTIDMVGKTKTVSCVIPAEVLRQFR